MRLVVQRVDRASVEVDGELVGSIGHGLVIFVGVGRADMAIAAGPRAACASPAAAGTAMHAAADHAVGPGTVDPAARTAALAKKIADLRMFSDPQGKSNLSLLDTGGAALVISQFTLYADCRHGRRPSFSEAADPAPAEALVQEFRAALDRLGVQTAGGRFGAHMTVSVVNDGPFTVIIDGD
jgi:D-tyrosyl-tRNA(Tyr) deacylase